MSEIHVNVTDQVMKLTQSPTLASGGVNETKVVFTFCEKWDGFVKTALFYRDTEKVYYAILENDTCILPWEVYAENGTFFFTVFGDKDNARRTAGVLRYKVGKGIVADDAMPSDPTPDVYDQIMTLLAKNNEIAADLEEKRDSGYFNGEKGEKGEKGDKGDQGDPGTPGSALIDDSVASTENAWSSKNTVDKLCPTFTESGSVVTCEPVEDYPLEVEWETKNLFDKSAVSVGFIDDASGEHNTANTTYRASDWMAVKGDYITITTTQTEGVWGAFYDAEKNFISKCVGYKSTPTQAIPANAKYVRLTVTPNAIDTFQVELGTTATAYQPYAETATIYHCGKNLFDMDGSLNNNFTKDGDVYIGHYDTPGYRFGKDIEIYIPAGSTVCLSAKILETNVVSGKPIQVNFTMKTGGPFQLRPGQYKTNIPSDVIKMAIYMDSEDINCTTKFKDLQLEFGNKVTAYEPYKAMNTYAVGEPIPALDGTNVIYPDVGTVTVTGKANPSAIIEKLTNAILSLGGNV